MNANGGIQTAGKLIKGSVFASSANASTGVATGGNSTKRGEKKKLARSPSPQS